MRGSCMTRQARRGLTSLPPLWRLYMGQTSTILDHTGTCFLEERLICESDLYVCIYGTALCLVQDLLREKT